MMVVCAMLVCGLSGCGVKQKRVYKIAPCLPNSDINQNDGISGQGPYNPSSGPQIENDFTKNNGHNDYSESPAGQQINDEATRVYHIGPGDVLIVKIYQLLELEKEAVINVEVDRNGQIYVPILQHVRVTGMTIEEVKKELVSRLSENFIRNPKVNVNIQSHGSKIVMLLGKVRQPGPLALQSDAAKLLDVISRGGGISAGAAPDIEILRGAYQSHSNKTFSPVAASGTGQVYFEREVVPISRLFAEEDDGQINPLIYPGDVIKVHSDRDGYIYMSGEFEQPGAKTFRRPFTILQALSCAGGPTNIAAQDKCRVIRRTPEGREKEIVVDLKKIRKGQEENLILARNDTIVVPVDPWLKFLDDLNNLIRRGVDTGMEVRYDAGAEMGIPSGPGF